VRSLTTLLKRLSAKILKTGEARNRFSHMAENLRGFGARGGGKKDAGADRNRRDDEQGLPGF